MQVNHIVRKGTNPLLLTICCPKSLSRRQTILSNRTLQNLRIQRHRGLINQRQTRDCNTDGCHRVSQNPVLSLLYVSTRPSRSSKWPRRPQGHQNHQESLKVIKVIKAIKKATAGCQCLLMSLRLTTVLVAPLTLSGYICTFILSPIFPPHDWVACLATSSTTIMWHMFTAERQAQMQTYM